MLLFVSVNPFELLPWLLPSIRWLERKFCVVPIVLGIAAAYYLLKWDVFAVLFSTAPLASLLPVALYCLLPVSLVALWRTAIEAYLRSGRHPKIGLVYEAFGVQQPHVQKARELLADLYTRGELSTLTSLKFFPTHAIRDDATAKRYLQRYNLSILVHIDQSKASRSDAPVFHTRFHMCSKEHNVKLVNEMLRSFVPSRPHPAGGDSVLHLLKLGANTVSDLILTFVTLQRMLDQDFEDSAALLRCIEQRMPKDLDPTQPPRATIRLFDAFARIRPTHFPIAEIPFPDRLNELRQLADTATPYATQFPWVAAAISRIRFLADDPIGALDVVDECLQANPRAEQDVVLLLAKAFLEFHELRW